MGEKGEREKRRKGKKERHQWRRSMWLCHMMQSCEPRPQPKRANSNAITVSSSVARTMSTARGLLGLPTAVQTSILRRCTFFDQLQDPMAAMAYSALHAIFRRERERDSMKLPDVRVPKDCRRAR